MHSSTILAMAFASLALGHPFEMIQRDINSGPDRPGFYAPGRVVERDPQASEVIRPGGEALAARDPQATRAGSALATRAPQRTIVPPGDQSLAARDPQVTQVITIPEGEELAARDPQVSAPRRGSAPAVARAPQATEVIRPGGN
ncbi:hypothetical protein HBI56_151760 [Parastagonospora nodorum]|nr:hypothetical protein HBI03_178790 [Parastagonospora nodorum]KAH4266754.1 hypothetical protein HBI04_173810 [Parastagonospora nodorum]KAH4343683.1 hypothetical protein HBH98_145640 [Parastagonospora nodorum]KAH4371195.1 hypothetical protein HBH97_138020 [Parastagonospora nodorum]KAH4394084.1 hypothetical protein HBH99_141060 [Parastagonospora nodorum]